MMRTRRSYIALAMVLPAVLLLGVVSVALLHAQAPAPTGEISGVIEGAPQGVALAGTRVVLVQFRIGEDGSPKGQPIQEHTVQADGRYQFRGVPIEPRTVYQLGATVGEQVVGSQPFTFPAGERQVLLNLHFPRVVTDASTLRIEEALVAVEPRRGSVWVTEVLHLVNAGGDVVNAVQRPLELALPPGAGTVELLRGAKDGSGHDRLGSKLLVYGQFQPGRTTLAYRYPLSVWMGGFDLLLQYPYMAAHLSVLAPEGSLRVTAPRFTAAEARKFDQGRFEVWSTTDLPAHEAVHVAFSGVPLRQELFLVPAGAFLLAMGGVVVWFLRRRLRPATQDE